MSDETNTLQSDKSLDLEDFRVIEPTEEDIDEELDILNPGFDFDSGNEN